jgi:hypothetical protein
MRRVFISSNADFSLSAASAKSARSEATCASREGANSCADNGSSATSSAVHVGSDAKYCSISCCSPLTSHAPIETAGTLHCADAGFLPLLRFLTCGCGSCTAVLVVGVSGLSKPARRIASRMMAARMSSSVGVACMNSAPFVYHCRITAPRHSGLLGFEKKTIKKKMNLKRHD